MSEASVGIGVVFSAVARTNCEIDLASPAQHALHNAALLWYNGSKTQHSQTIRPTSHHDSDAAAVRQHPTRHCPLQIPDPPVLTRLATQTQSSRRAHATSHASPGACARCPRHHPPSAATPPAAPPPPSLPPLPPLPPPSLSAPVSKSEIRQRLPAKGLGTSTNPTACRLRIIMQQAQPDDQVPTCGCYPHPPILTSAAAASTSAPPSPAGSSTARLSTAADSSCSAGLGHQASAWMGAPRVHVRMQRPVRTSQRRREPSSPPDASHWPPGWGAMQRTWAAHGHAEFVSNQYIHHAMGCTRGIMCRMWAAHAHWAMGSRRPHQQIRPRDASRKGDPVAETCRQLVSRQYPPQCGLSCGVSPDAEQ